MPCHATDGITATHTLTLAHVPIQRQSPSRKHLNTSVNPPPVKQMPGVECFATLKRKTTDAHCKWVSKYSLFKKQTRILLY
jgi:hypothetical protein